MAQTRHSVPDTCSCGIAQALCGEERGMQGTPMPWRRMVLKVLVPERSWRTGFWGCCLPVFRLTSASSSGSFFFFFFVLSQRAGVALGHWFGLEQMRLQIPVTADDVGDRKQVPLTSASGLICRGGSCGLASCAPLIWTRPEPYSGIFTMPPERNFLFIFFSLGRNSLQPVSYDFLPHSSSYLPRTLNICVVLERAAAVLCTPSLPTALHHCIFSTTVQCLPAGPHSALLFTSHGQASLQGQLAWTGELLGAATSSQYDLASLCHWCNACVKQGSSDKHLLCARRKSPGSFWLLLVCLSLYFDVSDAAKGLGLRTRPVPPPCTGICGQVIWTESSLLFLLSETFGQDTSVYPFAYPSRC